MRPAPEWVSSPRGADEPASRKRPGTAPGIDLAPHQVPGLGHVLVLVDQDRGRGVEQPSGIGERDAALRGVVQGVDGGGAAGGGRRLPHPLRADDHKRRQGGHQLVELLVKDAGKVRPGRGRISHAWKYYHYDGGCATVTSVITLPSCGAMCPESPGELEGAISAASIVELHFGVLVAAEADERARRTQRLGVVEATFDPLPIDVAVARAARGRAASSTSRCPEDVVGILGPILRHDATEDDRLRLIDLELRPLVKGLPSGGPNALRGRCPQLAAPLRRAAPATPCGCNRR